MGFFPPPSPHSPSPGDAGFFWFVFRSDLDREELGNSDCQARGKGDLVFREGPETIFCTVWTSKAHASIVFQQKETEIQIFFSEVA